MVLLPLGLCLFEVLIALRYPLTAATSKSCSGCCFHRNSTVDLTIIVNLSVGTWSLRFFPLFYNFDFWTSMKCDRYDYFSVRHVESTLALP